MRYDPGHLKKNIMNFIIQNTALAEIISSGAAAGSKWNFPNIEYLTNVRIRGLICHASDVDYSKSTSGYTITTVAQLRLTTVTLYVEGMTPVLQFPAYQLIASNNGGFIRQLAGLKVNLPKSYVQINGTTGFADNDTFAFSFLYD